MSRVLLLEFNELSPVLMDRFIAEGHLPAFKALRDRSATFITEAGETGERLNPWVQWVTVHTGATADEHGIAKLGEAHNLTLPTIADLVSDAGRTVWLCGSMNVQPIGSVNGAVLPDPWSVDATPQPPELEPFFRFVRANVQEHTNERQPLSKRDVVAFLRFLIGHGLRPSTALRAVRQLVAERTSRSPRGRRAEVLDRFQWDVFRYYHRRLHPAFATFFSNSTAHFQHVHWDQLERDAERSEVLHGYRQMDRLVAQAIALVGDDVTVALCTALSQSANVDGFDYDGFYRPCQLEQLPAGLALGGCRATSPVMAEQFHLLFEDDAAARAAEHRLLEACVGDDPVFDVHRSGEDLLVGCRYIARRAAGQQITMASGATVAFDNLFYWTDAPRQGTHHPDGLFWIGVGARTARDVRIPLTAVAPTILSVLGVTPPSSMIDTPAGVLVS